MAYQNKEICNPYTGQSIRFLRTSRDTGGSLLEMETSYTPFSTEPTPHFHPAQDELFTIISGELSVRMNGKLRRYTPGQQFRVPRNTTHSMWNNSQWTTIVNWQVMPALVTENFLENTMGLAMDSRTRKDGTPRLLQLALLLPAYRNVFRAGFPPIFIQNILFTILKPFALLAGYKSSYGKYID